MPSSAGGAVGWMFATGTASVVCTKVGSMRTHNVSATLDVSDGVAEGVGEGLSEFGAVLIGTSGGTLGDFSSAGPLQPASSTTVSAEAVTTRRIRMMTQTLARGPELPFADRVFVGTGVVPPELTQPDGRGD